MNDEKLTGNIKELMLDLRAALSVMLQDDESGNVVCVETDRVKELRLFYALNAYLADDVYDPAPADFDRHIVIYGNPAQGFQVAGPFVDWESAQDFAGGFDDTDWWANKLTEAGR